MGVLQGKHEQSTCILSPYLFLWILEVLSIRQKHKVSAPFTGMLRLSKGRARQCSPHVFLYLDTQLILTKVSKRVWLQNARSQVMLSSIVPFTTLIQLFQEKVWQGFSSPSFDNHPRSRPDFTTPSGETKIALEAQLRSGASESKGLFESQLRRFCKKEGVMLSYYLYLFSFLSCINS